ncbi:hypothetical protein D9619_011310 [Psilocybe cf. subviscida]|uniref:Flavodoxin-like domain-containing protein n=1 Tax=Psilocybe cf. subviscida TaxID=2480587 RepID=A0A8H5BJ21_9AGAR|nr:hypothetical protein D9619_011310 [Psilocybe cf. subviscida]
MCFPSKKQKNNFADGPEKAAKPASGTADIKDKPTTSASVQPQPPSASAPPPVSDAPTLPTIAPVSEMSSPKVAIVIYTMYGHIAKLAEAEKAGIEKAGGTAVIYQVEETLPQEVLTKMYAPAKPDYPIMTPDLLTTFDAFLFGVPTRFGSMPAQWKTFWDSTGQKWASGAYSGKYGGFFVSTAGIGGGQETTILTSLTNLTHHGIIYVPFGYAHAFAQLSNIEEVHGGSPWGAGTYSSSNGSRQPTPLELEVATNQGTAFWNTVSKVKF